MYPPPPEYLAERRLLTRKLSFWRFAGIGALIVAVAVAGWRLSGDRSHAGPHIARLTITGVIKDDREMLKLVRDVTASSASAAILSIDSPGGTTTGAEALYEELRRLAEKKPTVAVVEGAAASGAYIAALAADGIVARGNSMVGSIGVLMQMPNASKLMETVGVKMEEIKSSPLKAAPNGYEPTSPEARAALDSLVKDSYAWFRGLVKDRRGMDDATLQTVADGRVFTGRQAVGLKLIDQLGDEKTAVAWLVAQKKVGADTPVRDFKLTPRFGDMTFLRATASVALDAIGLGALARQVEQSGVVQAVDRLGLDGMLALWHPSPAN